MTGAYLKLTGENWFYIALVLDHSVSTCIRHYNKHIRSKAWTPDEVLRLRKVTASLGDCTLTKRYWQRVSNYVATRRPRECKQKWAEIGGGQ
jgi:hypothetical protein